MSDPLEALERLGPAFGRWPTTEANERELRYIAVVRAALEKQTETEAALERCSHHGSEMADEASAWKGRAEAALAEGDDLAASLGRMRKRAISAEEKQTEMEAWVAEYEAWASSMPDAGLTADDPRARWYLRRPQYPNFRALAAQPVPLPADPPESR